jgi:hypothetical protein
MNTYLLTRAESGDVPVVELRLVPGGQPVPTRQQIEQLRLFNLLEQKRKDREFKLRAAKRALALANKLKNPSAKKKHQSRIFSAMNKLRVAV